jgi:TPR repeat protein
MKRLLTALAVLLLLVTPVAAQDIDKGLEAVERGDSEVALRELRPLAQRGVARAQMALGAMYLYGIGVPHDYAEAMKWSIKAAEQNDDTAQLNVGMMYLRALSVRRNRVRAQMWFNLAAMKGSATAIEHRDTNAQELSPRNIKKAQRMAREWLEAHPQ